MTSATAILVVKTLAGCSAAALMCSPVFLIYRIFKRKDVGVASVIPLVALHSNCLVWTLYGYMIKSWLPIFWVYLFGVVVSLVFLSVYWWFTNDRAFVNRVLLVMSATIATYTVVAGLCYTNQSRENVGFVLDVLADVAAVCLYGAPMEKLLQVLKYKSAAFINAHMVIAGLTQNTIWFMYSVLIDNWFIMLICILFASLNSFTLVLCVAFNPKTHPLPTNFRVGGDNTSDSTSSIVIAHDSFSCSLKASNALPSPAAFESIESPLV